jgi:hypothetical protein
MNTIHRLSVAIVMAVAILPALAFGQDVQTDYDHSVNFSQYHTYSWGPVHASDPLFEPRIREAVDRALEAKGWQQVPEDGDVTVTAVGTKKSQAEYTTFYDGFGPGWRWHGWGTGWATTNVQEVPVGSLVVDLYETSSKRLIWRGVARDILSDKPEKNTQKLEKAADKMFAKFPPRSS